MIKSSTQLAQLLEALADVGRVGVDTEADSLHCYREKLCLIQIGLPESNELVDPLAGLELAPLFDALSTREVVLHGADFDLRLINRAGVHAPERVFDTMVAARLTGADKFSYAALVAKHFDVTLPKGAQKSNWARRPLPPKIEEYARNDTRYLLPLAELLERELGRLGRLDWLAQSTARTIAAAKVPPVRDMETVWRVKGSGALGPQASAVLRALWHWRDEQAQAVDRPPFHIFLNEDLIDSAQRFASGKEVSGGRLRGARREQFFGAAEQALELDESQWPQRVREARPRRTRASEKRFVELRKRRDQIAGELEIDPGLIAARAAMERIAADSERGLAELLPWQRQLLAPDTQ